VLLLRQQIMRIKKGMGVLAAVLTCIFMLSTFHGTDRDSTGMFIVATNADSCSLKMTKIDNYGTYPPQNNFLFLPGTWSSLIFRAHSRSDLALAYP
jgi:hypothetical protein